MLLTNDELQLVRETVEIQSGMDADLVQRCSPLIHINAFDNAVRQAFVVLEERLRKLLKRERLTGIQMVQFAFSEKGPFTKMLADNQYEREGFEHLLCAALKLYRNPSMHGIVGYSGADARGIIRLVDIILRRLDRLATLPQLDSLPANAEQTLLSIQKNVDAKAVNQLHLFLAKCASAGLTIDPAATRWIPFRMRALTQRPNWEKPKSHILAVFYLLTSEKDEALWFPVNTYYKHVVGINTEDIMRRLRSLGLQLTTSAQEPYLSVNVARTKDYYDQLFAAVQQIIKELGATLG